MFDNKLFGTARSSAKASQRSNNNSIDYSSQANPWHTDQENPTVPSTVEKFDKTSRSKTVNRGFYYGKDGKPVHFIKIVTSAKPKQPLKTKSPLR